MAEIPLRKARCDQLYAHSREHPPNEQSYASILRISQQQLLLSVEQLNGGRTCGIAPMPASGLGNAALRVFKGRSSLADNGTVG